MQISELSPKSWSFREDRIYLCHCVRHSQVLSITFVSFSSSLLLALSQGRISFKTSKTSFCLFILSRSLAFALLRRYLLKRAFFDSRSFIDLFGSFLFTSVSKRFFTDVFLNDLDLSGMAGFDSAMVTYQVQLGGSGRRRTERARTHVRRNTRTLYRDRWLSARALRCKRLGIALPGLRSLAPGSTWAGRALPTCVGGARALIGPAGYRWRQGLSLATSSWLVPPRAQFTGQHIVTCREPFTEGSTSKKGAGDL